MRDGVALEGTHTNLLAVFRGEDPSYVYTRLGNPTQTALETEMAYLEKGEAALALANQGG